MTKEQQKYLNQRLAVIREDKPRSRYCFPAHLRLKKPSHVVAAEKAVATAQRTIKAWEKRDESHRDAIIKHVNDAHDHCKRMILTGDWKAALLAVDRFASRKF